ncbi:MAG TPA: MFS transporter [Ktedonobacteraceae bacterium]|nr:MFS transporter [Ktedonobacteraceae bacterium]
MSKLLSAQQERVRSPLYRPAFLRLWLGLMFSRVGDQLTVVALIWFVLQLTGSGIAIGLIVLCFQLPAVVASPLMGSLLDRYQPRTIMAVDNFGRACIIAAIPLLYLTGALHLWMVYALALCSGVLSPASSVGLNIVVPKIVPDGELERANSLAAISWDFSTLIGPAIAGFLIIFTGAPLVLLIDALSFLLMGAMVLALPRIERSHTQDEGVGAGKRAGNLFGFGTLFRMKTVFLLSTLTLLFLFMQGLTEVAIPVYSQKTLGAGSAGYGLLMTAFSAGSLLSLALISQRWTKSRRQGITLAAILLLSGLALAPLIVIHALSLALVVIGLAGLAAAPYYVVEQSIAQRLVPEQVRGQIFGARGALNVAGYPLGGMVGGVLLGTLGVPFAFATAVLLCLLMGIMCLASPAIRGLRQA